MIDLNVIDRLPAAPFKVRHNDLDEIGGLVELTPTGFTYWNGQRTIEIDDQYEVEEGIDSSLFTSKAYDSVIEITPLRLEDRSLLLDGADISNIVELRQAATRALTISINPASDPIDDDDDYTTEPSISAMAVESLCFTITDDEDVLELVVSHPSGVAVRDNGEWLELNLDEDNPSVDDLEWLDVSDAAIPFWDAASADDKPVKRADVLKYAVNVE